MVKFSFIALASALATASAAGRVRKTIKLGNRELRRGEPGTEALLKKAVPYKKNTAKKASAARRRLDGEVEFDGSYSLKFSQCIDVKTYDEDLFDEDIVAYAKEGQVVSSSSYVLFHVCQGDNCYYDAEDDIYMVDLPTYLTNVALYHANVRKDYCEQCQEFEDYCNPEEEEADDEEDEDEDDKDEDEAEEDEAEEDDKDEQEDENEEEDENEDQQEEEEGNEDEQENEGEDNEEGDENQEDRKLKKKGRKLKKKQRRLIERKLAGNYIDCDQCQTYECYVDEEDMDDQYVRQEDLDDSVSEWIQDLAECKESGKQWNGLDLYIGAMCSPYSDGVELAYFVNEDCTMYTNQMSFYGNYNYANDENNEYNINYVTYAENYIKNAFSQVMPCQQQEFDDPDEEDDGNDDKDEEYEMNDYCKEVLEGDVSDFNNCAADDEQNEDEENDDQYNWYTYDLKEADDIDEVCYALNQMAGEYNHVYDEEASGTWYERNSSGEIKSAGQSDGLSLDLSPGIIAIIVGVAVLILGGAAFLLKPKKKPQDSNGPVYVGGTML